MINISIVKLQFCLFLKYCDRKKNGYGKKVDGIIYTIAVYFLLFLSIALLPSPPLSLHPFLSLTFYFPTQASLLHNTRFRSLFLFFSLTLSLTYSLFILSLFFIALDYLFLLSVDILVSILTGNCIIIIKKTPIPHSSQQTSHRDSHVDTDAASH